MAGGVQFHTITGFRAENSFFFVENKKEIESSFYFIQRFNGFVRIMNSCVCECGVY